MSSRSIAESKEAPIGTSTTAVRLRAPAPKEPSIARELGRTAGTLFARLALYGGVAAALFLAGSLGGIWLYAGDPDLPESLGRTGVLASWSETVEKRRASIDDESARWNRLEERLRRLNGDLVGLRVSIQEIDRAPSASPASTGGSSKEVLTAISKLAGSLGEHDLQSRFDGDVRWCTALYLHGWTADACDAIELDLRPLDRPVDQSR